MLSLLPSKDQWRRWSKPTKYQFVGMVTSLAALGVAVLGILIQPAQLPHQSNRTTSDELRTRADASTTQRSGFQSERSRLVARLNDASTCLTARLYRDSLNPMESDCQMDVSGLASFFRSYAPIFATTPYSGAENAEMLAQWTEGEVQTINTLRSQAQLIGYQKRTGINLPQIAYYLCGFEWYIRASPPDGLEAMEPSRVRMYQSTWLNWNKSTGSQFQQVPFEIDGGEVADPGCISFVDVLD